MTKLVLGFQRFFYTATKEFCSNESNNSMENVRNCCVRVLKKFQSSDVYNFNIEYEIRQFKP